MISRLKNHELDQKIKSLAQAERELLSDVLEHISEADCRKLYLDYDYPNLFSYLVKSCGYPGGSAQRRTDATRLLVVEPRLKDKIQSGEINLSQTSILQMAIREKNKTSKVTKKEKRNLISKISQKSVAETQVVVSRELNIQLKECTKETHQKDESVRLEITLSKEQWQKLQRAKDLASNATNSNDLATFLEYLSDKLIKHKEGSTATVAVKKLVLQRDKVCQHVNQYTGKICGSSWQLQVDHIQPIWAGGTDDPDNLRAFCQKHNNERYKQQAGIKQLPYTPKANGELIILTD